MSSGPNRPKVAVVAASFLLAAGIFLLWSGMLWAIAEAWGLGLGSGPGSFWAQAGSVGPAGILVGMVFIGLAFGVWRGSRRAWYLAIILGLFCLVYPELQLLLSLAGDQDLLVLWADIGALAVMTTIGLVLSIWLYSSDKKWPFGNRRADTPVPAGPLAKKQGRGHGILKKAEAVGILFLLVYGGLYVSGKDYQMSLFTSKQTLPNHSVYSYGACVEGYQYPCFGESNNDYCGQLPGSLLCGANAPTNSDYIAASAEAQAYIVDPYTGPSFPVAFEMYWPGQPAGYTNSSESQYAGQLSFYLGFPTCAGSGLVVSSVNISYEVSGPDIPSFSLDTFSFAPSYYSSAHSELQTGPDPNHPEEANLTYSGAEENNCGSYLWDPWAPYGSAHIQEVGFTTSVATSVCVAGINGFYCSPVSDHKYPSYSFNVVVGVKLSGAGSGVTPFIGQTYTGSVTIPIGVVPDGAALVTAS